MMINIQQLMRYLLLTFGTLSLALGIAGIFLPLLPTTPFLLLTAACYARSSERYHNWLLNHPWFGDYIRNYQAGNGMPLRAKVITITLIWISISISAASVSTSTPWLPPLLLLIAISVTAYLLLYLPTLRLNGSTAAEAESNE